MAPQQPLKEGGQGRGCLKAELQALPPQPLLLAVTWHQVPWAGTCPAAEMLAQPSVPLGCSPTAKQLPENNQGQTPLGPQREGC